jgi:hypothetical protein
LIRICIEAILMASLRSPNRIEEVVSQQELFGYHVMIGELAARICCCSISSLA